MLKGTNVNTVDGAALGVRMGCGRVGGSRETEGWNRRAEKHRRGKPERFQKETRQEAESLAGL